VGSLVQLSLEPEFRRGHGALYDALAAGRVEGARLFSLLTEVLPLLVGGPEARARGPGPEARAWTAWHDVIDRRMLDRTPAPGRTTRDRQDPRALVLPTRRPRSIISLSARQPKGSQT
jgi:hypothetical protein